MHADADWAARNATIERITLLGRAAWKVAAGYHRRSLAETAMFRLKTIFGPLLTSRSLAGQQAEAALRCAILNRMTQIGLPNGPASVRPRLMQQRRIKQRFVFRLMYSAKCYFGLCGQIRTSY